MSAAIDISRRCPLCRGVSLIINNSLRRSFSVTSADRISKFVEKEFAIPDNVLIVQGATIMPPVINDPLAIDAETSLLS